MKVVGGIADKLRETDYILYIPGIESEELMGFDDVVALRLDRVGHEIRGSIVTLKGIYRSTHGDPTLKDTIKRMIIQIKQLEKMVYDAMLGTPAQTANGHPIYSRSDAEGLYKAIQAKATGVFGKSVKEEEIKRELRQISGTALLTKSPTFKHGRNDLNLRTVGVVRRLRRGLLP